MASSVLQNPHRERNPVFREGAERPVRKIAGRIRWRNRIRKRIRKVIFAMINKALGLMVMGALLLGLLYALRLSLGRRLSVR